jgi:RNA methyltransferase, TrmH family
MTIRSAQNPKIQKVRALIAQRKNRETASAFVIEGVRLVEESLRANWLPEMVLVSERLSERGQALVDPLLQAGVEILPVDAGLLNSLSAAETSQGILAILQQRSSGLPSGWDFLIVADNLRDPGNLGTLMRTAAAAGVDGLILTPGSVDPYSPKVLRSAMGAHFHLPILKLDWSQISQLCKQRGGQPAQMVIANASDGEACWQTDFSTPLALVIGGEAEGVHPQAYELADRLVHIPMSGNTESLNAATAAAILIFEVVRQRQS